METAPRRARSPRTSPTRSIAAPPADRPAHPNAIARMLVQVRLAISQRATMAITLGRNYVQGKALFELALEVARAAADRLGEANSLHNIAQAAYFLAITPPRPRPTSRSSRSAARSTTQT